MSDDEDSDFMDRQAEESSDEDGGSSSDDSDDEEDEEEGRLPVFYLSPTKVALLSLSL